MVELLLKKNKEESQVTGKSSEGGPSASLGEREALAARVRESIDYITLKRLCNETELTEEHYVGLYSFIEKRACRFWKYLRLRESGKRDPDPFRAVIIAEYARLLSLLVKHHPNFQDKIFREVLKQFPEDFREAKPLSPLQLVRRLDQCNQKEYFSGASPAAAPGTGPEGKDDFAYFSQDRALDQDKNAVTRVHARGEGTDPGLLPDDLRVCLRILKGPNELSVLEIPEAPAYVGRDPLSTARIRHQTVSRRHAVISFENHRFHIKDLGSTNGTVLNSQRVTESALKDGDIIHFGEVICQFVVQAKKN
ncbi:MAG: FHA domain-containing protein [bacterium]|nr:FHA domain-containing protein [bacterium]